MKMQFFETCTTYLVQNVTPKSIKIQLFETKITEIHFFETCTTYLVQNGIPNSIKIPLFELNFTEVHFLRRVRDIWSKIASRNPQKGAWIHIFGPGPSTTSPAGPPGQPGRQCRPVGLASRRASLAAHGPAGCDPQVLQLAVGSGRGGEGGGRADNSPAPPLLSPQVGYLVYTSS